MKKITAALVASLVVSGSALAASTGEVMAERGLRASETAATVTVENAAKKPVAKQDLSQKSEN